MAEHVTVRSAGTQRVEASNGTSTRVLDLPQHLGGPGKEFGPHETLLAALGACTILTLESYAKLKGLPLEGVEVAVHREPAPVGDPAGVEQLTLEMRLRGALDEAQRARLLQIAQKCPVYKTLTGRPSVVERLAT